MEALAYFVALVALLLLQDYFAPSSIGMIRFEWMGDMDHLYVAYRRRFFRRGIVVLVGSAIYALSGALNWPESIQIALLIITVASHIGLVLFDITKSRRFH